MLFESFINFERLNYLFDLYVIVIFVKRVKKEVKFIGYDSGRNFEKVGVTFLKKLISDVLSAHREVCFFIPVMRQFMIRKLLNRKVFIGNLNNGKTNRLGIQNVHVVNEVF